MTSKQLNGLALGVGLLSWTGLGYVVLTQSPSALTKALLFPLLFLAAASVATPCLIWLRRRLGKKEEEPEVVLRQGAWFGLYVSLCAGLQMARVLDATVALTLGAVLILLELFLLQRPERLYELWYRRTRRKHKSKRKR